MKKRKIFLDLDGTMAEWKAASSEEELLSKGYFLKLKGTGLIESVKILLGTGKYDIYILSAVDERNPYAKNEKISWVRNKIPDFPLEHILFSRCGSSKREYAKSQFGTLDDSVLIDDYSVNLRDWEKEGTAIKFLNGINASHGRSYRHSIREDGNPLINALHIAGVLENA